MSFEGLNKCCNDYAVSRTGTYVTLFIISKILIFVNYGTGNKPIIILFLHSPFILAYAF